MPSPRGRAVTRSLWTGRCARCAWACSSTMRTGAAASARCTTRSCAAPGRGRPRPRRKRSSRPVHPGRRRRELPRERARVPLVDGGRRQHGAARTAGASRPRRSTRPTPSTASARACSARWSGATPRRRRRRPSGCRCSCACSPRSWTLCPTCPSATKQLLRRGVGDKRQASALLVMAFLQSLKAIMADASDSAEDPGDQPGAPHPQGLARGLARVAGAHPPPAGGGAEELSRLEKRNEADRKRYLDGLEGAKRDYLAANVAARKEVQRAARTRYNNLVGEGQRPQQGACRGNGSAQGAAR